MYILAVNQYDEDMSQGFESAPRPIEPEPEGQKPDVVKTPEQPLSLEAVEIIMQKVQDINQKETAFHGVTHNNAKANEELQDKGLLIGGKVQDRYKYEEEHKAIAIREKLNNLESILRDGLLGISKNAGSSENRTREEWVKSARKDRRSFVYFNIIGRDLENVKQSDYTRGSNALGVIFALDTFKEDLEGFSESRKKIYEEMGYADHYEKDGGDYYVYPSNDSSYKSKTFGSNSTGSHKIELEHPINSGKFKTIRKHGDPNNGFALSFRVAPRFFKGIVTEADKPFSPYIKEEEQQKYKQERVDEIVSRMMKIDVGKENLLLPIYDFEGNLLWPKQMSYEEVKKFVAERDKKEGNPAENPPTETG
jgi:hypothetical protein